MHYKKTILIAILIVIFLIGSSKDTIAANTTIESSTENHSSAISGPIRFEHYSVESGLPSNTVLYSIQDHEGFLWFATPEGLARFDGQNFRVFRTDKENENSISHNNIFSLAVDQDGVLWVGTDGGGLNRYDAATESFKAFQLDENDPASLSNNSVWSLYIDADNQLWVGTRGGLNLFDRETETFSAYQHDEDNPRSIANDVILGIEETADGTLWVGTRTGLSRFDSESKDFTNYHHDPENPDSLSDDQVWDIMEDRNGDLWLATRYGGLNRMDRSTETFEAYTHDENDPTTISHDAVFHVYEDSTGNFWVATEAGGVNLFNRETGTFSRYQHDPNDSLTLSSDDIFWIMEDDSGSIWFTSRRNGINQYVPAIQRFAYYHYSINQPMSLSTNNVYALWGEGNGVYWIGTGGAGLDRIDSKRGSSFSFQHDPEDPKSLPNNTIYAIYGEEGDDGIYWIGTVGGGLARFDSHRYSFTTYTRDPEDPSTLSSNYITVINSAGDGKLWVGTLGLGLDLFDTKTGKVIEHITHDPDDPNSLQENTIFALLPEEDGTLWIGTARGGVDHYNPATKQFTHYMHDENDPDSLANNAVNALTLDIRGRLWVGTSDGLSVFNPDTLKFKTYTEKDGLPGNAVYGVLVDEQNNDVWVSTSGGLGQFQQSNLEWRNYDVHDGLQGTQFNLFAYAKSLDGEFLFAGANGVNVFCPEGILRNSYVPEVILTGVQIWNQRVPIGEDQLPMALNLTDTITLSPDDDMVTIQYSATNYQIRQHNLFQTKLEGFSEEWSPATTKTEVTYTNLNPGTYTLLIKTANNDLIWNETPRELTIIVQPDWYETLQFRIGMITMIAMIAYGIFLWRTQVLKNQKQELALRIQERTAELQEEVKHRKTVEGELRLSNQRLEAQVAEISDLHKKIKAQAIRDDLTGLFNRRYLNENLPRELSRAQRKNYELTFMLLDLDHFKQINDQYGHAVGDKVLVSFSETLMGLTREMDIVCRYGGEEFVIVAPDLNQDQAQKRAEDIRATIETIPVSIPGAKDPISITASIGVACYPTHAEDVNELINAADTALYDVKHAGRNQIRVYEKR